MQVNAIGSVMMAPVVLPPVTLAPAAGASTMDLAVAAGGMSLGRAAMFMAFDLMMDDFIASKQAYLDALKHKNSAAACSPIYAYRPAPAGQNSIKKLAAAEMALAMTIAIA